MTGCTHSLALGSRGYEDLDRSHDKQRTKSRPNARTKDMLIELGGKGGVNMKLHMGLDIVENLSHRSCEIFTTRAEIRAAGLTHFSC